MNRLTWLTTAALTALLGLSVSARCAEALTLSEFSASVSVGGALSRQAGAHVDLKTRLAFPTTENPGNGLRSTEGNPKEIRVDLPPGFVGNPTIVPTCPLADVALPNGGSGCPVTSVVGSADVDAGLARTITPIYNVVPGPQTPALFAFVVFNVPVFLEPEVRPGDYGISTLSARTSQAQQIFGATVEFWGVPGDPSHDSLRTETGLPVSSPLGRVPFLSSPSSCNGVPERFTASVDSWQEPDVFSQLTVDADPEGASFVFGGCDRLPFAPRAKLRPESVAAGAPVGFDMEIALPQNEGPDGVSTADVRRTSLTFPAGFSISSAAASGLAGCGESEVGLGSGDPPTCPDASEIGDVEIKTPLLQEALEGHLYLAEQKHNPFGSNYAFYLVAKGPGFYVKLPGKLDADPTTGQVTATIDNQPQLPYDEVSLQLYGGARAPFVNPAACGRFEADVQMESWASTVPVDLKTPVTVSQDCSSGSFSPGLKAGTKSPLAGSFSPFVLQVTRQDGEANLSKIQATLPPGLLAKLGGVPVCGDAQAATGDCPAGSQVGRTVVGVGAGSSPIYIPESGKSPTAVYLGGPYKGAPYSLVVTVPAQAGPFDLGTVVVRNALTVDPFTTQVTAESDPLPQILEGIPVSYRDVRVEVDRPEFTVNPTNCSQFAVTSSLTSATGQTASPQAPFAAANCERLAFKPRLKLQLKGSTKRTGKPALKAVLTYPRKGAYANIARAQVNLPGSEFLEQANLNKTCTRPVLMEGRCPKSAVYGKAKAWSPLLDKPLRGPVYLVGGFGYQLPALVADLGGQIRVILKGKIDTGRNHGLRTTFEGVPDARVSRFVLQMKGGKKYGLLVNSEDLCRKPQKLKAAFTAQNGKTEAFEQKIATGCGGKKAGR